MEEPSNNTTASGGQAPGNKPILVGIAFLLPLLFVGVVFVTSYIPSATLSTDYDFIYATCSEGNTPYSYNCSNYLNNLYGVEDGTLVERPVSAVLDSDRDEIPDIDENYRTRLFYHDTELNQSREITLDEARAFRLRDLITSPDGVAVEWEYSRSRGYFIFYGSSSSYGYYLTRGNARKRLDLIHDGERYYYRDDFQFIGWVLN